MAANKRQLKPDQPLLILNLRAAYHATPAAALMTFLGRAIICSSRPI